MLSTTGDAPESLLEINRIVQTETSLPVRLQAYYHVQGDARTIEARAQSITIEQSVETPLAALDDRYVQSQIVGRVEAIIDKQNGVFEICISLAPETVGRDAGQLLNMLF